MPGDSCEFVVAGSERMCEAEVLSTAIIIETGFSIAPSLLKVGQAFVTIFCTGDES